MSLATVVCALCMAMGGHTPAAISAGRLLTHGITAASRLGLAPTAPLPELLHALATAAKWSEEAIVHDGVMARLPPQLRLQHPIYAPHAPLAWATLLARFTACDRGWTLAAIGDVAPGLSGLSLQPANPRVGLFVTQPALLVPGLSNLQLARQVAFAVACREVGWPSVTHLLRAPPSSFEQTGNHRVILTTEAADRLLLEMVNTIRQARPTATPGSNPETLNGATY